METALSRLQFLAYEANTRPDAPGTIPSMLQPSEKTYLYLIARDYYSGEGDIFDGGICLGGCTDCFARGLANRNDLPDRPLLHAYDQALVTVPKYFQEWGLERKMGESTLDIIEANIAAMPRPERIVFHHGDILQQPYPEKIEIMFLDVCKNRKINQAMQALFSRLIPGKSIIIQQDYIHPWNPYIHASMGFLDEYFEAVGPVLFSTMVYLLKKAIPEDLLAFDAYEHTPVPTLQQYIMMQAPKLLHPAQISELQLACAVMLYDKGEHSACLELLSRTQSKPCLTGELEAVTERLITKIEQEHGI